MVLECAEMEFNEAVTSERVKNIIGYLLVLIGTALVTGFFVYSYYAEELGTVQLMTAGLIGGIFLSAGFVLSWKVMAPEMKARR